MRNLGKATHILSNDPALRRPVRTADQTDEEAAAELAAFDAALAHARATGDRSGLPTLSSRKPVLWRLRGLSMYGWEEVSAEGNTSRMCRRAVQFGLVGMDDAYATDGERLVYAPQVDPGGGQIAHLDVVEEIYGRYGGEAIVELGVRILELSSLRPQSGQGS